jgi:hypothetical protein
MRRSNSSMMGVCIRHGPHHGAKKSTNVGNSLFIKELNPSISTFLLSSYALNNKHHQKKFSKIGEKICIV